MPKLLLPSTVSQPQYPARINPQAVGLAKPFLAVNLADPRATNLVTGTPATIAGTPRQRAAAIGSSLSLGGDGFHTDALTYPGAVDASVHSGFTACATFVWRPSPTDDDNYPVLCASSTGAANGFAIRSAQYDGGSICMVKLGTATLNSVTISANTPYTMVTSHDTVSGDYYMLVRNMQTGEVTVATQTETSAGFPNDVTANVGGPMYAWTPWDGEISMCVMAFEYLPRVRAEAWLLNPWAIFAQQPRRLWVDTVATGITVPVSGVHATGSVRSVTVRANATATAVRAQATGRAGSTTVTADASAVAPRADAVGRVGSVGFKATGSVDVTQVSASGLLRSAQGLGSATVLASQFIALSRVSPVTISLPKTVLAPRVTATGAVRPVTAYAVSDATVLAPSLHATGHLRPVTTSVGFKLTTQRATGLLRAPTIAISCTVLATTQRATGQLRGATVRLSVTGQHAVGRLGTVTISADAIVLAPRLTARGRVGVIPFIQPVVVLASRKSATGKLRKALAYGSQWGIIPSLQESTWTPTAGGDVEGWNSSPVPSTSNWKRE